MVVLLTRRLSAVKPTYKMSSAPTPMSGQSSAPVASPDWKRSRVEDSLDGCSDPEVEAGIVLDGEDLVETLEHELKKAKLDKKLAKARKACRSKASSRQSLASDWSNVYE